MATVSAHKKNVDLSSVYIEKIVNELQLGRFMSGKDFLNHLKNVCSISNPKQNINAQLKKHYGNTLLHLAIGYFDSRDSYTAGMLFDIVKFLIQEGADVNIQNDFGEIPLSLLAYKINTKYKAAKNDAPIHKHLAGLFSYLVYDAGGIDFSYLSTPRIAEIAVTAVKVGDKSLAYQLLEMIPQISEFNKKQADCLTHNDDIIYANLFELLFSVIKSGDANLLEYVVNKLHNDQFLRYANKNSYFYDSPDVMGTPFLYVINKIGASLLKESGDWGRMFECFVRNGVNLDGIDPDPVYWDIPANDNGKGDVCNSRSLSPLYLAAKNGNLEICKRLIDAGAKIDGLNNAYRPAPILGVIDGNPDEEMGSRYDVLKLFIRHGAQLENADSGFSFVDAVIKKMEDLQWGSVAIDDLNDRFRKDFPDLCERLNWDASMMSRYLWRCSGRSI